MEAWTGRSSEGVAASWVPAWICPSSACRPLLPVKDGEKAAVISTFANDQRFGLAIAEWPEMLSPITEMPGGR